MSSFHTGCPVVSRSMQTFCQFATVGGEHRKLEFSREILWLQESEAQLHFMHGGRVLENGEKHNDFYGYLTSFQRMAMSGGQAEITAASYSITQESSLELVLVAKLMKCPAVETEEDARHNSTKPDSYKSRYSSVPGDWRHEEPNPDWKPEDGEQFRFLWPPLEAVVIEEAVVWSSKNTPGKNFGLVQAAIDKWSIPK